MRKRHDIQPTHHKAMPGQTTEKAFETYVEEILLSRGGWKSGSNVEWDKERALFPAQVFAFIQDTQSKLWQEMKDQHAAGLETLLLTTLVKELDAKGSLHVLRHGFKFYGKTFRLAAFKPAHGANYEVLEQFGKNRLTVTRQVPCHPNDNRTLDMVLAVNGLPVSTIELKNPGTGQSWRNAVRQYKEDRDPRAPLFDFKKRALVHFAADPDEIHMTTRLAGEKTYFLPFNRGSHPGKIICGAGNPQHESGYRTGYFWEDVLQFESFLDILGHFMFLEKKEEKVDDGRGGHRWVTKETMVFPRYHQLDAVRQRENQQYFVAVPPPRQSAQR
jgi:type I restriction enzyme R subunit